MADPPKKLKRDAIVEALLEIQFEHSELAEVVLGKLAGSSLWGDYRKMRLPVAELPAGLRDSDRQLRFQPIFQLDRPTPGEVIKLGARVLSLHVVAPYPGWSVFRERLNVLVKALYDAVPSPVITRLGLRYINALTPSHGFQDVWDLDFTLTAGGAKPAGAVTATYQFGVSPNAQAQVAIATLGFVQGVIIPEATAFVDVDISTPVPLGVVGEEKLIAWIDEAHAAEKEAFFALWPEAVLSRMKEE